MPLQRRMGFGTKNTRERKLSTLMFFVFYNVTCLYSVQIVQRLATVYACSMCLTLPLHCVPHLLRHRSPSAGEAGAAAAYICCPQLHQQVKKSTVTTVQFAVMHIQVNMRLHQWFQKSSGGLLRWIASLFGNWVVLLHWMHPSCLWYGDLNSFKSLMQ